ncbi:matrixin family metalloprotease [Arthrobacter sp. NicSoilB8]|uniref:matrixin family metalloprotease n=1 Tax=Arthrobacter sp. NicSoilB8 TaxID=2830998 RepID=UPI001CC4C68B|nr:matrixin family metalloprotease [Arthrobacter sp. NicSoilB8]
MRVIRNLAAAAVIAGAAFLAAGLIYGDPRFTGLFEVSRGAGQNTGHNAGQNPGHNQGADPKAAPRSGRESGQPAVPAGESRADTPPPGIEEQDNPLGSPRKPETASTSYKFLATNEDGSPVGYSPCRPLHYVVNAALAPPGAGRLVDDSIRTISEATGIRFINDGPTSELSSPTREPYQKERYGDRWAPLLIAWTTPEQAPQLKGPVIGTGGSTHFSFGDGPKSFVTGSLELDAPQIAEDLDRTQGAAYATAVILHELGHVMGLEHVDDPAQLMYPEIGSPDGLAAGDLNGLYELGHAQCRKDL